MPDTISLLLIHSTMPLTSVPVPSVTMIELMPTHTTRMPFTTPVTPPAASASRIATPTGTPSCAFRIASTMADSVSTGAADRSYSPAVRLTSSA